MKATGIAQQARHYRQVFAWLFAAYYRAERRAFWLTQLLMGLSVALGLVWLLGLLAGLNFLNHSLPLEGFIVTWLQWFFALPLYSWLLLLSVCGLLSAGLLYVSFQVGVKSVVRFQTKLLEKVVKTVCQEDAGWLRATEQTPRKHLNRVVKSSVQLTGLVVRRLARLLIPSLTFLLATVALLKLDGKLSLLLLPLSLAYLVILYFINRSTARNQVALVAVGEQTQPALSALIEDSLVSSSYRANSFHRRLEQAKYDDFSQLRYKRRLAEIHVAWLNTLFLVLGSAVIVLVAVNNQTAQGVDWRHLILFLVALRYAVSGLQEIASGTVAFSRFLPETELLYRLLQTSTTAGKTVDGVVCVFDGWSMGFELSRKKYHGLRPQNADWVALEQWENGQNSSKNIWIYASQAVKFKQLVRKFWPQIELVIVVDQQGREHFYTDKAQFLSEFQVEQFKKATATQTFELDDEI